MKCVVPFILVVGVFCINCSTSEAENTNSDGSSNSTQENVDKTIEVVENSVKSMLRTLMRRLIPHALRIGLNSDASLKCLLEMTTLYSSVRKLDPWAFRMLDAWGKLSGGLLEGTSMALGDYDECLDVDSGGNYPVYGGYCLVEIRPPENIVEAMKDFQVNKDRGNNTLAYTKSFLGFLKKVRTNPNHVIFRLGVCLPSSCSEEGIQSLIDLAVESLDAPDVPIEVVRCVSKGDFYLELHQVIIMSFLGIIIASVIICTVIAIIRKRNNIIPQSTAPSFSDPCLENHKGDKIPFEHETCIWSRFSVCTNTQKLFDCNEEGDALDVVRGLKVLTVLFAIFTHTYALPHPLHMYRFRDTLNFVKFMDDILFAAVANCSVGVDTIFFLAGFYFVYNRWRLFKRPSPLRYISKFIFLMILRMILIQVLVGSLFFLLPVFGSGPLWEEFVEEPLNNCRNNWWMNLLFIQNNNGPYDICLYQTWILGTMMQIFFITAVFVYVMHRCSLYGILCNVIAIGIGSMAIAAVTAIAGYPATISVYFYDYRTAIYVWKYLYTQFYTHIGPQCIGMLTAYLIAEYPFRKLNKSNVIILWIACLVTLSSVIFGLHNYRNGEEMERGLAVFYAAVHRLVWAMAIGWMVYACAAGYGGFVNSLFCWKVFIPLERLCYLAYLLHLPIMYYQGGIQRERLFMGHYNQIMNFISYTVTSFALAYVCYLFFQAPYEGIEGLIFKKYNGNVWEEKPETGSQVTLKSTENVDKVADEEDGKSRVLYTRTERF